MRFKNRIMLLLLLIVAVSGGMSFWLYQRKPAADKNPKMIFIPKTEDGKNAFWTELIGGTKMAARELNVDLSVEAPKRELDVDQQVEIIQNAIREYPDAILISPSSYTKSTELLKTAKKEGIAVVFIDSYIDEEVQDLTVSTDNVKAGSILGAYAYGLLEAKDQLAVIGHVQGVSTAMERERGFLEGLGTMADNVTEIVYCNSDYDKAYQLAMELMEKYPELKMIAGLNEYSFVGAARAVKDAGAQNRIKIIGIDSSIEAIDMMEQGIIDGVVVQKAFKMGYFGVKETMNLLDGKSVPKQIDSGCELVTRQNMYDSEIERLIYPFDESNQRATETIQ